ncbi:unnamed protein product [Pleuronectes platessa]|uniref:Uncharacterized protein n=1 Tax=Pleuronectes platessa TaxID=8262 RepID=A0A9N7VQU2_PLEPL|nr:unnamed protein product [Pleuronectes platessa]
MRPAGSFYDNLHQLAASQEESYLQSSPYETWHTVRDDTAAVKVLTTAKRRTNPLASVAGFNKPLARQRESDTFRPSFESISTKHLFECPRRRTGSPKPPGIIQQEL